MHNFFVGKCLTVSEKLHLGDKKKTNKEKHIGQFHFNFLTPPMEDWKI